MAAPFQDASLAAATLVLARDGGLTAQDNAARFSPLPRAALPPCLSSAVSWDRSIPPGARSQRTS